MNSQWFRPTSLPTFLPYQYDDPDQKRIYSIQTAQENTIHAQAQMFIASAENTQTTPSHTERIVPYGEGEWITKLFFYLLLQFGLTGIGECDAFYSVFGANCSH